MITMHQSHVFTFKEGSGILPEDFLELTFSFIPNRKELIECVRHVLTDMDKGIDGLKFFLAAEKIPEIPKVDTSTEVKIKDKTILIGHITDFIFKNDHHKDLGNL